MTTEFYSNDASHPRRKKVSYEDVRKTTLSSYTSSTILELQRQVDGWLWHYPFAVEVIDSQKANLIFENLYVGMDLGFIAYCSILQTSFLLAQTSFDGYENFQLINDKYTSLPYAVISVSCSTIEEVLEMGNELQQLAYESLTDIFENFYCKVAILKEDNTPDEKGDLDIKNRQVKSDNNTLFIKANNTI